MNSNSLRVPLTALAFGEHDVITEFLNMELDGAGQVFTVILIFSGVGTAFYSATLLATIIVEGGLHRRFEQRRINRMLHDIRDHFILCGFGRIGSIVARELDEQGTPFVIIERSPDRLRPALERGWLAIQDDASREDVLRQAGIERARGLITAVGTDAENVYAVLTARGLRPDLFIVGRAESEDAMRKLTRAGADRVISPYFISGLRMAAATKGLVVEADMGGKVKTFVQLNAIGWLLGAAGLVMVALGFGLFIVLGILFSWLNIWSICQAVERAAGIEAPPRARHLRTLMQGLEPRQLGLGGRDLTRETQQDDPLARDQPIKFGTFCRGKAALAGEGVQFGFATPDQIQKPASPVY